MVAFSSVIKARTPVLNGGTSASAPMTAAAAAVVPQAAKITGRPLDPAAVRSVLEKTARPVASPPQADDRAGPGDRAGVPLAGQH